MKKSNFLRKIHFAAQVLYRMSDGIQREQYHNDVEVGIAAAIFGLKASGTLNSCPISRSIISAAFNPNILEVLADAEAAWEHCQTEPGGSVLLESEDVTCIQPQTAPR